MDRVIRSALWTGLACVVLLAGLAAVDGYLHGAGANHQHPAGYAGAATQAMIATVFLGWTAFGLGAIAGAGGAMATALARRLCRCRRPASGDGPAVPA